MRNTWTYFCALISPRSNLYPPARLARISLNGNGKFFTYAPLFLLQTVFIGGASTMVQEEKKSCSHTNCYFYKNMFSTNDNKVRKVAVRALF